MNEATKSILDSIKSDFVKNRMVDINRHLYNRKQEGQIRDSLLFYINDFSPLDGLSEFPKKGHGAVDLTLMRGASSVATIEFKHHYPKDLKIKSDIASIINDITRVVVEPTSHFVLIIQEREKSTTILPELKYMDRNEEKFSEDLLSDLEGNDLFPTQYKRYISEINAQGLVMSKYIFVVYEFGSHRSYVD